MDPSGQIYFDREEFIPKADKQRLEEARLAEFAAIRENLNALQAAEDHSLGVAGSE